MAKNEVKEQADDQRSAVVIFRQQLESMKTQFALLLPPNITPDFFARVIINATNATPRLLLCDRASLFNAALQAAEDGLIPDKREGAIVPFKKGKDDGGMTVGKSGDYIATWIPMVRGIRKLIRQSGEIADLHCNLVYVDENDAGAFVYESGDPTNATIRHIPQAPPAGVDPAKRKVYCGYSIALFKDGTVSREVMFEAEIMAVGRRSKSFESGPWSDPLFALEMRKKTVTKRHFKQLPTDRTIERVLSRDDALHDFAERKQEDQRRPVEIGRGAGAALQHFATPTVDPIREREIVSHETEREQPNRDEQASNEAPKSNEARQGDKPAADSAPPETGKGKGDAVKSTDGPESEPSPPKTTAGYVGWARHWMKAGGATADALKARWNREKALRNACNLEPEAREALEAELDAAIGGKA